MSSSQRPAASRGSNRASRFQARGIRPYSAHLTRRAKLLRHSLPPGLALLGPLGILAIACFVGLGVAQESVRRRAGQPATAQSPLEQVSAETEGEPTRAAAPVKEIPDAAPGPDRKQSRAPRSAAAPRAVVEKPASKRSGHRGHNTTPPGATPDDKSARNEAAATTIEPAAASGNDPFDGVVPESAPAKSRPPGGAESAQRLAELTPLSKQREQLIAEIETARRDKDLDGEFDSAFQLREVERAMLRRIGTWPEAEQVPFEPLRDQHVGLLKYLADQYEAADAKSSERLWREIVFHLGKLDRLIWH